MENDRTKRPASGLKRKPCTWQAPVKNCVFIDFNERNKCSMDNVEGVLSSLGPIHKEVINNPRTMDTLEEEFLVYQAMSEADIPAHI